MNDKQTVKRHEVQILCEYPTLSGGERSMMSTLDGVRRAGFSPVVLAPPDGPLATALRSRDIEVVPFFTRDDDGRPSQVQARERLRLYLIQRPPALLHANSLSMGRLSGPVVAELGVPSISHLRDIVGLSRQARADLNCHTRLLAVSEATRAFHVAAGLTAEKLHTLHNGVDLQQFRPRSTSGCLHRELGLPSNVRLIGAIGQLGLRKGFNVLLEAAIHLPEDVYVVLIGQRWSDKDESRRFEADLHATAERRLPGRVHFLGVRADVDRLLSEFTLLAHPASQEPLGRVLLEAAAAGVAVVATDVGGTREIFPPETESARLVPPGDPGRLADALRDVLSDDLLRTRMGVAARQRAETAFSVERASAGLIEHYRCVIGASPDTRLRDATIGG